MNECNNQFLFEDSENYIFGVGIGIFYMYLESLEFLYSCKYYEYNIKYSYPYSLIIVQTDF